MQTTRAVRTRAASEQIAPWKLQCKHSKGSSLKKQKDAKGDPLQSVLWVFGFTSGWGMFLHVLIVGCPWVSSRLESRLEVPIEPICRNGHRRLLHRMLVLHIIQYLQYLYLVYNVYMYRCAGWKGQHCSFFSTWLSFVVLGLTCWVCTT